jgi:hypothetical protein
MSQKLSLSAVSTVSDSEDYEDCTDSEEESMQTRHSAFISRITSFLSPSALRSRFGRLWTIFGNLAWIFTTSVLLIGLPVLFAYDREKNYEALEAEQSRFKTSGEDKK